MKHALEKNTVARELDTDEPRQTQIGRARNESFLAGRKVEVGTGFRKHAIHDAQELTTAADGEGFDCRDPRLLDVILVLFVVRFRTPMAAIDFMKQCQFASNKKIGKRNLSVVEMREVDAGVENTAAGVFR